MDLRPFNVHPSRRSVQLLIVSYGLLALLACYFLLGKCLLAGSIALVWWLFWGALFVALGLEFRRSYRRLLQQCGMLTWDDGLVIHWQGQRWSYRSALFLGSAGVVIWVRRERIDNALPRSSRWPQFVRFSREPIWLLPDMLPNAEWRRLCGKLVQTDQLLAEYR